MLARLHKVNPAINAVVRVLEARHAPRPRPPTPPAPAATRCRRCTACRSRPRSTWTRPAADRQRRGRLQGLRRQGRQPGRRQPQAGRRHHHRPHQRAGLLDAHLHRQRAPRPHAEPLGSDGDAGRLERRRRRGDRDRHRRDRATATTSAARCASRPTATAWSACARATAASPPTTPARQRARPIGGRADGGAGPADPHGARCARSRSR